MLSINLLILAVACVLFSCAFASPDIPAPFTDDDMKTLEGFFFKNINVNDTGAVLAAPSKTHPNYWFHWARDAAISMHITTLIQNDQTNLALFEKYANWTRFTQNQKDPNGIDIRGEPKFYLDGKAYDLPWGRPQNDGPALRAIALTSYANRLIAKGEKAKVEKELYIQDEHCCNIKSDLEYISQNWQSTSFDPWEETNGLNFFTSIVQRKALLVGAELADTLGDKVAADLYRQQAKLLEGFIGKHWNEKTGVIMETLPPHPGPVKLKELDSATFLGVLYGYHHDGFFSYDNDKVLATVFALQQYFNSSASGYTIQEKDLKNGVRGVLFGRYPGDTYNGYETNSHGNPWILTTCAAADLYYRVSGSASTHATISTKFPITKNSAAFYLYVAQESKDATLISLLENYNKGDKSANLFLSGDQLKKVAATLFTLADEILERIKFHVKGGYLHLAEELNKDDGYEQGAVDLTWSYGTLISAMNSRSHALKLL